VLGGGDEEDEEAVLDLSDLKVGESVSELDARYGQKSDERRTVTSFSINAALRRPNARV